METHPAPLLLLYCLLLFLEKLQKYTAVDIAGDQAQNQSLGKVFSSLQALETAFYASILIFLSQLQHPLVEGQALSFSLLPDSAPVFGTLILGLGKPGSQKRLIIH